MFRLCLGLSAAVAIRWLRCSGCALGESLLLCQGAGQRTPGDPQVAANDAQAAVLRQAWSCDADVLAAAASGHTQCTKACVYYDDALQLYGVLCWTEPSSREAAFPPGHLRPGVVLVHTAIGPRDLMLHWRAEALASLGYVVLIADMFGDALGDGWDAEWSAAARAPLTSSRACNTYRMQLALDALSTSPLVDASRLAVVGYCFGGLCALDLARANPEGLKAAISFHGILDNEPAPSAATTMHAHVLLCHGDADPFVSAADLESCLAQLREMNARWSLACFGGVKHAFTNPAQALNPNPNFGYDAHAANRSWDAARALLCKELQPMLRA